jgi:DNA-binding MarR family transcriptional regulator
LKYSDVEVSPITNERPAHSLEKDACELVGYLDVLVQRFLLSHPASEVDLSRQEMNLLSFLARKGASSMSDLASSLRLPLSSATGVVDRLFTKQLVSRDRAVDDRRVVRISLTSQGEQAYSACFNQRVALGRAMLSALDVKEREQMMRLFRKIALQVGGDT